MMVSDQTGIETHPPSRPVGARPEPHLRTNTYCQRYYGNDILAITIKTTSFNTHNR